MQEFESAEDLATQAYNISVMSDIKEGVKRVLFGPDSQATVIEVERVRKHNTKGTPLSHFMAKVALLEGEPDLEGSSGFKLAVVAQANEIDKYGAFTLSDKHIKKPAIGMYDGLVLELLDTANSDLYRTFATYHPNTGFYVDGYSQVSYRSQEITNGQNHILSRSYGISVPYGNTANESFNPLYVAAEILRNGHTDVLANKRISAFPGIEYYNITSAPEDSAVSINGSAYLETIVGLALHSRGLLSAIAHSRN